jgi:hypothetical protein
VRHPSNNRLKGAVRRLRPGASGAEKLCAFGALGRFYAAPQLHRRPHMGKWRYTLSLSFLMSLSGCIEITTYVSPSASGTVVDAATKKPIRGATISVDDHPGLFAQTNSDGQFSLAATTRTTHIFWLAPYRSLPPSGTVVVSADGYASKEVVVNGSAGPLLVSLLRVR